LKIILFKFYRELTAARDQMLNLKAVKKKKKIIVRQLKALEKLTRASLIFSDEEIAGVLITV